MVHETTREEEGHRQRINIHFGVSLFIKTKTNSKYVYHNQKLKKTERYLLKRKVKTMNNLEIYFWDVRNDTRFFFLKYDYLLREHVQNG